MQKLLGKVFGAKVTGKLLRNLNFGSLMLPIFFGYVDVKVRQVEKSLLEQVAAPRVMRRCFVVGCVACMALGAQITRFCNVLDFLNYFKDVGLVREILWQNWYAFITY